MNAETLSGTVLGTCTLQKLIGRGGMGAVFLAQQSRPRRQVAVKVLLPITTFQPQQRAAFLERFRRETDAAASLEHLNIMPVHEYGEQNGLAYLVMPYVGGGTLRDELEPHNQLPFPRIINYLDQIASALDFAHERGVIHRDIKPANILMTPEKRLLLTDFGLVKVVSDEQPQQNPLSVIGMPMGTPDYMAPEQVVGGEINSRADLYSLGIVLYQMVTGSVPFTGDMPMKVALQHMHTPPPSPRTLRPDLPAATEQVILRALAKRPDDRYMHARDLTSAFRLTLEAAGIHVGNAAVAAGAPRAATEERRRNLFDPSWRTGNKAAPVGQVDTATEGASPTDRLPAASFGLAKRASLLNKPEQRNDIVGQTSMTMPSFSGLLTPTQMSQSAANMIKQTPLPLPPMADQENPVEAPVWNAPQPGSRLRLGRKNSLRGLQSSTAVPYQAEATQAIQPPQNVSTSFGPNNGLPGATAHQFSPTAPPSQSPASTQQFDFATTTSPLNQAARTTRQLEPFVPTVASATGALPQQGLQPGATGALQLPKGEYNGETGMLKLAQPVRVVRVPVAGQPGQYMTGILPMLPPTPVPEPVAFKDRMLALPGTMQRNKLHTALIGAVVLLLLGSCVFLIAHLSASSTGSLTSTVRTMPDKAATGTAHAYATASANNIISDSLAYNSHNWNTAPSTTQIAVFKDNAFHITATNAGSIADALLPDYTAPANFVYSLTMAEIKGDDADNTRGSLPNNYFGMILRYNMTQNDGKSNTFYSFVILHDATGAQYEFREYQGSKEAWTTLWHKTVGNEYKIGQGAENSNTVSIAVNGDKYTFTVNGQKIDTVQNGDYQGGQIGMMVNKVGTEVAFTNLELTLS